MVVQRSKAGGSTKVGATVVLGDADVVGAPEVTTGGRLVDTDGWDCAVDVVVPSGDPPQPAPAVRSTRPAKMTAWRRMGDTTLIG
jgi:hypothetical protein